MLTNTGYGPGVDLWSIGVITYILLCGFPPFYGDTIPEMFEQIMSGKFDFPAEYWGSISNNAKDFISKLLVVDTKKRLTAQQALEHPWLKPKVSKAKQKLTPIEDSKSNCQIQRLLLPPSWHRSFLAVCRPPSPPDIRRPTRRPSEAISKSEENEKNGTFFKFLFLSEQFHARDDFFYSSNRQRDAKLSLN